MAYWGEAMASTSRCGFSRRSTRAGRRWRSLAPTPEARAAKAKTPREQGYLRAVEALFGRGDKPARAAAYAQAMAHVAAEYPADDEAQTFYALALLAMLPRGDAALPFARRPARSPRACSRAIRKHPGAAHYILHAYDHAALARGRCRRRAPTRRSRRRRATRCTCRRMRSCKLGFWDEAAASDEASWNASIAWAKRRGLPISIRDFHSLSWLQYEWTQQGRFSKTKEAIAFVDEAIKASRPQDRKTSTSPQHAGGHHYGEQSEIGRGNTEAALRNDRGSMRARYIIESERWSEMKGQASFDNIDELFALGIERRQSRRCGTRAAGDRRTQKGIAPPRSRPSCANRPR